MLHEHTVPILDRYEEVGGGSESREGREGGREGAAVSPVYFRFTLQSPPQIYIDWFTSKGRGVSEQTSSQTPFSPIPPPANHIVSTVLIFGWFYWGGKV
jgi:hypothetical protein